MFDWCDTFASFKAQVFLPIIRTVRGGPAHQTVTFARLLHGRNHNVACFIGDILCSWLGHTGTWFTKVCMRELAIPCESTCHSVFRLEYNGNQIYLDSLWLQSLTTCVAEDLQTISVRVFANLKYRILFQCSMGFDFGMSCIIFLFTWAHHIMLLCFEINCTVGDQWDKQAESYASNLNRFSSTSTCCYRALLRFHRLVFCLCFAWSLDSWMSVYIRLSGEERLMMASVRNRKTGWIIWVERAWTRQASARNNDEGARRECKCNVQF